MVADDFVDDEADELFAEVGIEVGFFRELPQACDLAFLARWVGRREVPLGLVVPNGLGDAKALRQDVDQRGVNVVDAGPEGGKHGIGSGSVLVHRGLR